MDIRLGFRGGKGLENSDKFVMGVFRQLEGRDESGLLKDFSETVVDGVLQFCRTHPRYHKTSLLTLPRLAEYLGIGALYVKDESTRFGLNAFKAMGALHGVGSYLANKIGKNLRQTSFEQLKSAASPERIGNITFVTATDGNHGRAVAWAAREFGHKAVIYMPKGTSQQRLDAIMAEGADAKITSLTYDDCVRLAKAKAQEHGWVVAQDTAWDGYTDIPLWIMQGYASMALEVREQIDRDPTHVFLQAGVGSFAGAIAAYLAETHGDKTPFISIVEPHQANCFFRSMAAGEYTTVSGDLDTIMAGLACGEPNPIAWDIVKATASASFSCRDEVTALGMRILGNPLRDDPRIVSGESGGVTTGLLYHLSKRPQWREQLGLSHDSVVLLFSTEGDTDVNRYRDVVWQGRYTYPDVN